MPQVQYHPNSPNADLMGAPIKSDLNSNYPAVIQCRPGYAQAVGSSMVRSATCGEENWVPSNLTQLITCAPGCPTPDIANGAAYTPGREVEGVAPYTVGYRVGLQCGDGFVLSGADTLTCTALMRWKPATLPQCVTRTASTVSAGGWCCPNIILLWLILLSVCMGLW